MRVWKRDSCQASQLEQKQLVSSHSSDNTPSIDYHGGQLGTRLKLLVPACVVEEITL